MHVTNFAYNLAFLSECIPKEVEMPDKRRVLLNVFDTCGIVPGSRVGYQCMGKKPPHKTSQSILPFIAMMDYYLKWADGVMLVWDSQERETLGIMMDAHDRVYTARDNCPCPIVLVGNYSDDTEYWIAYEQGQQLAKELGYPFFAVSAQTGKNIAEAFCELTRLVDSEVRQDDYSGKQGCNHHYF